MKKTMALFGLMMVMLLTTAFSCSYNMIANLSDDFEKDFRYNEIEEQQIDFAGKTRFELDNDAGEITITGWDQPYVQMVATKHAKSQRALAEATIDILDQGSTLVIRVDHPDHDDFDWMVDFELQVPNNADVYVNQGAGKILIQDLTGLRDVDLGAGEVDLHNIVTSSLHTDVGAGDVKITGLLAQSVDLNLGTGDLMLEPVDNAVFERVDVNVGMGEASLRDIQANEITANVGMGDLNIGLLADASYQIDADVGMGDLSIRGFGQMNIDQSGLMSQSANGTLGNGQGRLRADVGIGSLSVYASN